MLRTLNSVIRVCALTSRIVRNALDEFKRELPVGGATRNSRPARCVGESAQPATARLCAGKQRDVRISYIGRRPEAVPLLPGHISRDLGF